MQQPRHLVLVLVGHQLVQIERDGARERLAARRRFLLGLSARFDESPVASGVGGVLVEGQLALAVCDQASSVRRLGRSLRRLRGAARPQAASAKTRPHRKAFKFFSAATPFSRMACSIAASESGMRPSCQATPGEEDIRLQVAPKEPFRDARSVDEEVLLGACGAADRSTELSVRRENRQPRRTVSPVGVWWRVDDGDRAVGMSAHQILRARPRRPRRIPAADPPRRS